MVPPLLTPRAAHSMVALGGKLYVAGGYGPQERQLRSVELFDPHVHCWEVGGFARLRLATAVDSH